MAQPDPSTDATEIVKRADTSLERQAETDEARRYADAEVLVARKAKLSSEQLIPLMRKRIDAWREWGEALGPAESKAESGRKGGEAVPERDSLTKADRNDRERARKIYAVAKDFPEKYETYLLVDEPDKLTLAGLLRVDAMGVHYSSESDEWETPQAFYDVIHDEFHPELDVCALPSSAKCKRYFTPEDDGLTQEWEGICWMNPPYGTEIPHWVEKAWTSAAAGAIVVCLLPARVDTNWWWDFCRFAEIRFIRGRLKFGDSETSAPFPSALVVFGRDACVKWWEWQR